jgi:hypothetical protein
MCSTMQALRCPNDPPNCAAHCAEMANVPVCKAEMGAFIACVARQEPSASRCNEDGEAEIRDGFCDKEQELVAQCLEKAG